MSLPNSHTSAAYSITVTLKIKNSPGEFARILTKVAEVGGSLSEVTLLSNDFHHTVRVITINATSEEHAEELKHSVSAMEEVELLTSQDDTFAAHVGGKLTVATRSDLSNNDQLSRIYSPGVARVCKHIEKHPESVFDYTIKKNSVAVISDGSAVLGLGNIGPKGAMPVMEGKAALFKKFGGVDAYPICLDTQDPKEIINIVRAISVGFGGINLEDISAPRCFEIERTLQAQLDIPVFHDDQHGTAIVVLAGLLNALKIVGKDLSTVKIVVNGFGAGGVACTRMIHDAGGRNIIPCDSKGVVYRGRSHMNSEKEEVLKFTNPENEKGTLTDALKGADIFLGVSVPDALTRDDIKKMGKDPIVFALSNPVPEVNPESIGDVARIIATGRSDYANQVNNVLCFPGIFRGALDARAKSITPAMKRAAAYAIAEAISPADLREDNIIPSCFDVRVPGLVSKAVIKAALAS